MPKFRSKPVIIDAILLEDTNDSIVNAVEFVYNIGTESSEIIMQTTVANVRTAGGFYIKTLEGTMKADFGDWIIKGLKGEFYPCKPEIFEMKYELLK